MNVLTYGKTELKQLVYGSAFLGSGGGGGLALANQLLELVAGDAQVNVIEQSELGGRTCSIAAFVGSPTSGTPNTAALLSAYDLLGGTDCVVPGEIGAVNSLSPFLVAIARGKSVLNGDTAGRALPKISMASYNHFNSTPRMAVSNGRGIECIISTQLDITSADAILRAIIGDKATFGDVGGLALWSISSDDALSWTIWGTIERTRSLGEAILSGLSVDSLTNKLTDIGRNVLFTYSGTLHTTPLNVGGGFDIGMVKVSGTADARTLFLENENMTYWRSDSREAIAAPVSLCYWDSVAKRPFTNVEAASYEGKDVTVFGIEALPELTSSAGAMAGFRQFLLDFGYAGKVPGYSGSAGHRAAVT